MVFPKEMFFVEVDEIVFKVTSAMVMMLTKLSLFLEVVSSGCLCLSVRFVRKDFYCEGNSVFMQEIIMEKDLYICKYCICFPRVGEVLNVFLKDIILFISHIVDTCSLNGFP